MTHRFPIKEVARQAGLSTATVDRVLNDRNHVSPQTRRRVEDAIVELEGQENQLSARGRRMFLDMVVDAPERFCLEIRRATEAVLPAFSPAVVRPRFFFKEKMTETECCAILARIARRGSQGVCLKARDLPAIRHAISELAQKNIPVVTIFTDIVESKRLAYAGLDNFSAGRTAAYMMAKLLHNSVGTVLTTKSGALFEGENERQLGFCQALNTLRPDLQILDANRRANLPLNTAQRVEQTLAGVPDMVGIYSMGGDNLAILRVLDEMQQQPIVFIAHDLDDDNQQLLRDEKITVVLHHDLRQDIRGAFFHIMAAHKLVQLTSPLGETDIQVISPMNIPAGFSV